MARAKAAEAMGASYVGIHIAIDEQMQGKTPWDTLREVAAAVSIPVAVAGGINSETAPLAIEAGASIVVVGGAITKAADATAATRTIKQAIETLVPGAVGVLRARHRPRHPRACSAGSRPPTSPTPCTAAATSPGIRPLAPGIEAGGPGR